MGQRKAWSKEEDGALVQIIEVQKIKKWSTVSRIMETQFKIIGRTGKQCRERWHNQLDPSIKTTEWTTEEEAILFRLHNQFGNRWAKISQELQGRTDNCVKNHFYSTLRRGFRRMNKHILENRNVEGLKQLKPVMLSKLVAAAQDKYDKKLKLSDEMIDKAIQLKNKLIPLSQLQEHVAADQKEMQDLIRQILLFCKSYKRKKGKKSKKSNEDYGDYLYQHYQNQNQNVSENSQNKQEESEEESSTKKNSKTKPQYLNTLPSTKHQITKNSDLPQFLRKQSIVSNLYLQRKNKSKIIQQQNQYQGLNRRSSNISNLSGMFKMPSLHQRVSNLSLSNHLNFQGFTFGHYALDNSTNLVHKNLFGVEISNFNDLI